VNGALFYVGTRELYAGERTILALMECNALLARDRR
jgi:hypothetical protein